MRERTSERTRRMFVAMDVQRARDLAARGDLPGAREAWIRVNLLHPDSFEAHRGLGFFYECAREWDSAARQYERAIESYAEAAVDHAPSPGLAPPRTARASGSAGDEDASRRARAGDGPRRSARRRAGRPRAARRPADRPVSIALSGRPHGRAMARPAPSSDPPRGPMTRAPGPAHRPRLVSSARIALAVAVLSGAGCRGPPRRPRSR
jgi:tetratricopeptide (TPR) repeat protein